MTDTDQSTHRFFTFTIDAETGQVVKLETFDASGARYELSEQEKASLAQAGSERLEEVLEEAFEAGIDCVLGDGEESDPKSESSEEIELRQELLLPLIKRSRAKRLLRREILNRAILGTLISDSVKASAKVNGPGPAAGAGSQSGAKVETRAN